MQLKLDTYQQQLDRYRRLYKANNSIIWQEWIKKRVIKLKEEYENSQTDKKGS